LQPDLDKEFARLSLALGGAPFLSPNEARGEIDFPDSTEDGANEIGGAKQPPPDMTPMPDANAPTPIRAARGAKALNMRDFEHMLRALQAGQATEAEALIRGYLAGLSQRVDERLREGA